MKYVLIYFNQSRFLLPGHHIMHRGRKYINANEDDFRPIVHYIQITALTRLYRDTLMVEESVHKMVVDKNVALSLIFRALNST